MLRLIASGFLAALLLVSKSSAQDISTGRNSLSEGEAARADEEVIVRGRKLSELEFDIRIYMRRWSR